MNGTEKLNDALTKVNAYMIRSAARENELREILDLQNAADQKRSDAIKAMDSDALQAINAEVARIPERLAMLKAEDAADQDPRECLPKLWREYDKDQRKRETDLLLTLSKIKAEYKKVFEELMDEHQNALKKHRAISEYTGERFDRPVFSPGDQKNILVASKWLYDGEPVDSERRQIVGKNMYEV